MLYPEWLRRSIPLQIGVIVGALAIFWAIGGFEEDASRSPQQVESKASLCRMAENTHDAYIDGAREIGIVREAGVGDDGSFVLVVNEAKWNEWEFNQQELLAVAAWCQVAGESGRAIAVVVSADSNQQIATVVDGEFALNETVGR